MTQPYVPLSDPILELAARADAGQKLGMQAMEFAMNLATRFGMTLDFEGAAKAMEDSPVVDHLSGDTRMIEQQSRAITASILRRFANAPK